MTPTIDTPQWDIYSSLQDPQYISWYSKKQKVVALSTTEAEYLSGTEATKEAVWLRSFLSELGVCITKIVPVQLRRDNQSANALTRNPEYHAKIKHIHGRQRFIMEIVEQEQIIVEYIPTAKMIAD